MKRGASEHNLLWDASDECNRLVCAHCHVPFGFTAGGMVGGPERKIVIGYDDVGIDVLICVDCQRQVQDDDTPFDVLAMF